MGLSNLASKRIVVTGGGGRLGSRMVERFASWGGQVVALVVTEEEAARVPANDRHPVDTVRVDVTSEAGVIACFDEIASRHGRVDAIVHTIGMWSGAGLLETSKDDWDLILRVNLTSAFLCFREAVRHMGPGGTVIGISSRQGADGGVAQQAAYSAAKAGVVRLIESMAAEFADANITCHAIAPSTILFEEEGEGVQATEIIDLAAYLIRHGGALSGATVRAYG